MSISKDFKLTSVSGKIRAESDLGPLVDLVGTWKGTGFNQIWRPVNVSSGACQGDHFLELNETIETLKFDEIPGEIPNRGLFNQPDINLAGLTYLQQVQDANVLVNNKPAGIHIEPGIWVNIPATINPTDPSTVARMASIPHGTTFVAQGSALSINGAPNIGVVDITPFSIPPPPTPPPPPMDITPYPVGQGQSNPQPAPLFPTEQCLTNKSDCRTPLDVFPAALKNPLPNPAPLSKLQQLINDPNQLLRDAIQGQNIVSTTVLNISTTDLNPPTSGGGLSNIAFLQGGPLPPGPNAQSVRVDATFFIEKIKHKDGSNSFQLQYSQMVLLNFGPLSWPHVSVATLSKQDHES